MIDFLIIYELKKRELESVVLLGEELKRRGHSVEYFSFPARPHFLLPWLHRRARVVVTPAAYDNQALYILVYRACRAARKIVNLQWEQVWTVEAESDTSHFRFPSEMARQVLHTCWGGHTRELLLRAGIDAERAQVTGPIHMDFLRPEMRRYYRDRADLFGDYGLDTARKTVLFISSFAFASYTPSELAGQKVNLSDHEVDDFRDVSVASQREVLAWIDRALADDPTIAFIYRRHPAENDSPLLHALAEKHEHFHVISDHSVKQWILCADKIFTWYSTAIAEVYFAGKSCEVLRPVPMPPNLEVTLLTNAHTIDNYETFRASLDQDNAFPIPAEVMHDYYSVTESPAYQRTAELLEGVLRDDRLTLEWDRATLADFSKRLRQDLRRSVGGAVNRAAASAKRAIGRLLGLELARPESELLRRHSLGRAKLRADVATDEELRALGATMRALITAATGSTAPTGDR